MCIWANNMEISALSPFARDGTTHAGVIAFDLFAKKRVEQRWQEHSHRRRFDLLETAKRSPWQGIPRSIPCPPLWLTFCTLLPDGKRNRKYQFVFTMRRCILESTEKGGSFSPYRKQVKYPSCDPHSPSTPCPPTVPLYAMERSRGRRVGGWVVPERTEEKSTAPMLPRQGSELCSHCYT